MIGARLLRVGSSGCPHKSKSLNRNLAFDWLHVVVDQGSIVGG